MCSKHKKGIDFAFEVLYYHIVVKPQYLEEMGGNRNGNELGSSKSEC